MLLSEKTEMQGEAWIFQINGKNALRWGH